MNFEERINQHLENLGQMHLNYGLHDLSQEDQKKFLEQLLKYDSEEIGRLRKSFFSSAKTLYKDLRPLSSFTLSDDEDDIQMGEELLLQGKVGCILLAGGQGSRLNIEGPKGLAAVSPFRHKTLFQLFCEKTFQASKKMQMELPLAILTSPLNHEQIKSYLEQNQFFQLDPQQVDLFTQQLKPFFDAKGNLLLYSPGVLAEGPDGNGAALKLFYQTGIWEKWKERGIQHVHIVLIDNPLADPFDPNLCGFHFNSGSDVTVKAIFRESEEAKVGLLVEHKKRVHVIEYSEITEKERQARRPDGSFVYNLANISLFCFGMEFIENVATDPLASLPWHFAEKMSDVLVEEDKQLVRKKTVIHKCETFIFDHLLFAQRPQVLVYPKEEIFSPLKNPSGPDSFETVRQNLLASDRRQFFRVTGMSADHALFELDQAFYYPTEELLEKWKGRPLPNQQYIGP